MQIASNHRYNFVDPIIVAHVAHFQNIYSLSFIATG